MTSAADSAARHDPHGETGRDRAEGSSGAAPHLPVFAAFDALGLTGRDVAAMSAVTAPTVSKWRSGKARVPGERIVFMTLVLAHLLDEVRAMVDREDRDGGDAPKAGARQVGMISWRGRLDSARAYLAYQDVLNRALAAADVRDGARLFRVWWSSGGSRHWQERALGRGAA